MQHLRDAQAQGLSDAKRYLIACEKVREATYQLSNTTRRKHLAAQARRDSRPTTYERTGPVDLEGLRQLSTSPLANTPRKNKLTGATETIGDLARHLHDRIEPTNTTLPPPDTAWIQKKWRHSELGDHLLAAGHITASRNYAHTIDPFANYGKPVRWAAHARFGEDFDDRASYPTASNAMIS